MIVTLVAMMGSEAWATTCTASKTLSTQTCCSWKTTSSGVRYCSLWCTGSEICVNTIFGLSGSIVKDCTPGVTCPVTECAAYGTVSVDTSTGECDSTDLTNLNPTCGIKGLAVCSNPAKHFNFQGNAYTLPGAEGAIGDVKTCDKSGKCTNSLKLEPGDTSTICVNPNWNFLTFTASEFKASSCFCPGGYAQDKTTCCADSSRNADGTCAAVYGAGATTAGTSTCIRQLCTVDLSGYNPFTNFDLAYDCGRELVCGGPSGTPCTP